MESTGINLPLATAGVVPTSETNLTLNEAVATHRPAPIAKAHGAEKGGDSHVDSTQNTLW